MLDIHLFGIDCYSHFFKMYKTDDSKSLYIALGIPILERLCVWHFFHYCSQISK